MKDLCFVASCLLSHFQEVEIRVLMEWKAQVASLCGMEKLAFVGWRWVSIGFQEESSGPSEPFLLMFKASCVEKLSSLAVSQAVSFGAGDFLGRKG